MIQKKCGFEWTPLLITVLVVFGLVFSAIGAAPKPTTVELSGWLVDKCCSEKTPDPAKHTRSCNLMKSCAATGYGVMVKQADGSYKYYKFDKKGDTLATNYLKKTTKEDNLTVTAKGTWDGKILKVTSLKEMNMAVPVEMMGWLMDQDCVQKVKDPAMHTRTCAMMEACAASGYGIIIKQPSGAFKFYPFDKKGHNLAADYLKKTSKENNLAIMLSGTWDGKVIKVDSFQEMNLPATVELMGYLMDQCCSVKTKDPAKHTRTCAMMESCTASGYGLMVTLPEDVFVFYKFDEAGHNLAADYLKKTTKENNLTIMVQGTWDGEILKVTSLMECSGMEGMPGESIDDSMDMNM